MKKTLITGITMMTLAQVTLPILHQDTTQIPHIQAAEAINFDKGDQSEEEYVRSMIEQLLQQDVISIQMTAGDQEPTLSLLDLQNKSMKQSSTIALGDKEETLEGYFYDEGVYTEPISLSLSNIELANMDNPDAKKSVEELSQELEGKAILKEEEAVKGNVSIMIDSYKKMTEEFENFEEKDGKVIAKTANTDIKEAPNSDMLIQFYGEEASLSKELTIDPQAKTLTLKQIIHTEDTETTEEDPAGGIHLAPPTEMTYTFSETDETIPKLEELETITMEEFNKLIEDKGLKIMPQSGQ